MKAKEYYGIYFFWFVAFLYIVLSIFEPEKTQKAFFISCSLLIQIVPAIVLVIIFMTAINYFVNPEAVLKYAGKNSGIKGLFVAALCGILSHGSVYFWYPLLKQLRDYGARDSVSAVFLYNRAVKIPLLPLMMHYFGLKFAVLLSGYMIVASLIEGKIIDWVRR